MRNRLLILLGGVELATVLLAIYFEPTCRVRGTLRGESFFEGKPTSWWRRELQQWEVRKELGISWMGFRETVFDRTPTSLEKFRERWFPDRSAAEQLLELWIAESRRRGPRLLHGDDDAIPVLRELLDDPSPKIRLFAQIGLNMNPKIPGDDD